jgi:hypothetical protein
MSGFISIYKRALIVLPSAYRDRYCEPMVQTLEDMLADQQSLIAKGRVWLHAMLDLPVTATYQYAQLGGATMNQIPNYAKQGTLVSFSLLVPFFILITINVLIHPLTNAWIGVGYFGIFILPIIALLLSVGILGRLLASKKLSLQLRSLKQIQSNWMLFAVPLLALLIVGFAFGHDSVHCVSAGNPQQITECVSRG